MTYNLTEIELQELRNARVNLHKGLAALRFEVDGSIVDELVDRLKTLEALYNKSLSISGAKKEDIQPVLRWVKAEKRLPKKRHNYHVKVFTKSAVGDYVYNAARLFNGKYFEQEGYPEKKESVVEWLEETKQPVPSALEFAKWLEENTSVWKERNINGGEITLYRYHSNHDGRGNYILDDIYAEFMDKYEGEQPVPSKESQKQALIEIMEADQRDGIYGVSEIGLLEKELERLEAIDVSKQTTHENTKRLIRIGHVGLAIKLIKELQNAQKQSHG